MTVLTDAQKLAIQDTRTAIKDLRDVIQQIKSDFEDWDNTKPVGAPDTCPRIFTSLSDQADKKFIEIVLVLIEMLKRDTDMVFR